MSLGRFIIIMILCCLIYFGILMLIDSRFIIEYILGILLPLILGILTVIFANHSYKISPQFMNQFFIYTFISKFTIYALTFIGLFKFYSFYHIPFIISFVGCFVMLHISEAFFFKYIFR